MEQQKQYVVFERLLQAGRITAIELRIWKAEQHPPVGKTKEPREEMREIMRRFFTLYGINPSIQFSDTTFKEEFITEVTNLIATYYPSMSRPAIELAIELNLTNHFGLDRKPEVYGDRITATFLTEVLNIYRNRKGAIIQKLDKMIPPEDPAPNPDEVRANIAQLMEEDRISAKETGIYNPRLPELYYNLLITTGKIKETDEMVAQYMDRARRIRASMHQQGKIKSASPLSLKELDTTRRFLNQPISLAGIAKTEAVIDYLTRINQNE